MASLRRLARLSRNDLGLLLRALGAVVKVRAHLLRRTHDDLRRLIETHPITSDPSNAALTEVAWSVSSAARLIPGATCLTQANAGQLLLARRGHPSTVRLSVRMEKNGKLAPHAWLMSGNTIVLGGTSQEYGRHRMLHDYHLPDVAKT